MPMNNIQSWHREPWPWLLFVGPFIVIIASVITFWLAYSSSDPLVVDDYYKAGKAINMTLRRDVKARALHLSAKMKISEEKVFIVLRSDSGAALEPMLRLRITHATQRAKDRVLLLTASRRGEYGTSLASIAAGRYNLTLEDIEQTWRLTARWPAGGGKTEVALRAE